MEEQFIPYEQALSLKKLGFNEECFSTYSCNTHELSRNPSHDMADLPIDGQPYFWKNSKIHNSNITAPLWQQAFDWFREKYNLSGEVYNFKSEWHVDIEDIKQGFNIFSNEHSFPYEIYEESKLECLKKLIEIVKIK